MRVVVFDIETADWLSEGGPSRPEDLTIALVGIHDSSSGYASFLEHELRELWRILERTDLLVGYNSDHFDIPLLNKYYPGDLSSIHSLDLMKKIQEVTGRRLKLDAVAEGTLGQKKIGGGVQSLKWWREKEVEKVREYCLKDVELTKGIFDYALEHGGIKYKELGKTREVALDTSRWLRQGEGAMTFSLGI